MKDMETENQNQLKDSVLNRLVSDNICPTSKTWFVSYDILAWTLWLTATLVGALAVSVSLFVLSYHQYAFYELTHDNLYTFLEDVLPIIWFSILVVMILFSVYYFRHTKRGYRYAPWRILGSSLALSLVGGLALHTIGVGFSVDRWLGGMVSGYESQEKMEQRLWQDPDSGRLIGEFIGVDTVFPYNAIFLDIDGVEWRINTDDLHKDEVLELESGKAVRVFGQVLSKNPTYLHTCGVIPHIYGSDYDKYEIEEYRDAIKAHLSHFYSSDDELSNSICTKIEPIMRFRDQFTD